MPATMTDRQAQVDVTPAALAQLGELLAQHPEMAEQGLRIYVTPGGCHGYSYGMAFDLIASDDTVVEFDWLKVIVDPDSLPWVSDVTVDFTESEQGSSFCLITPNTGSGCDCDGSSGTSGGCCC
jgi:iron-sulfur cluster assembly accessory protein